MRVDLKRLTLCTALAGSLSVLAAGCGSPQETAGVPAAATTTVGTEIDDTVVTAKVKSALLADPDVKSVDLTVETRKGTVQLSGFVDNPGQIERAIAATRAVEGVAGVESNLVLKASGTTAGETVDDSIITTKVKTALLADPGIRSGDIAVVTRNGAVLLSGFVDNQVQIDRALDIAGKVDGVTGVGNEMTVKN